MSKNVWRILAALMLTSVFFFVFGVKVDDSILLKTKDMIDEFVILALYFWIIVDMIWQGFIFGHGRKKLNFALIAVISVVFCVVWLIFLLPFSIVREFIFLNSLITLFWINTLIVHLYIIYAFSVLAYFENDNESV